MVAICTGPAFATDDAGNLVLAGERRKTSNSPCALKDANGLFTDPSGGAWTVGQVSMMSMDHFATRSGAQVTGTASVPWAQFTKTWTNPTCWAIDLSVQCTWDMLCWVNNAATLWFEVGANADNATITGWSVKQSMQYYPAPGVNAPSYFDWLANHTQVMFQFRLAAHASRQLTFGARVTSRFGNGGTLQNCDYYVTSWGFAVES